MSSKSFIVLHYTFRFIIHLGYFLWWVEDLCVESFSFFLDFYLFLSLPPSIPPSFSPSLPYFLSLSLSLSPHLGILELTCVRSPATLKPPPILERAHGKSIETKKGWRSPSCWELVSPGPYVSKGVFRCFQLPLLRPRETGPSRVHWALTRLQSHKPNECCDSFNLTPNSTETNCLHWARPSCRFRSKRNVLSLGIVCFAAIVLTCCPPTVPIFLFFLANRTQTSSGQPCALPEVMEHDLFQPIMTIPFQLSQPPLSEGLLDDPALPTKCTRKSVYYGGSASRATVSIPQ